VLNIFVAPESRWGEVDDRFFAGPNDVCDLREEWATIRQIEPGVAECPSCGQRVEFRTLIAPAHMAAFDVFGGDSKAAVKLHCDKLWAVWRPVTKKWFAVIKKRLTPPGNNGRMKKKSWR
jgi:hypothetical protein